MEEEELVSLLYGGKDLLHVSHSEPAATSTVYMSHWPLRPTTYDQFPDSSLSNLLHVTERNRRLATPLIRRFLSLLSWRWFTRVWLQLLVSLVITSEPQVVDSDSLFSSTQTEAARWAVIPDLCLKRWSEAGRGNTQCLMVWPLLLLLLRCVVNNNSSMKRTPNNKRWIYLSPTREWKKTERRKLKKTVELHTWATTHTPSLHLRVLLCRVRLVLNSLRLMDGAVSIFMIIQHNIRLLPSQSYSCI